MKMEQCCDKCLTSSNLFMNMILSEQRKLHNYNTKQSSSWLLSANSLHKLKKTLSLMTVLNYGALCPAELKMYDIC